MAVLTDDIAVEAALMRPLTSFEADQLLELIPQVEVLLRSKLPTLDARIALWTDDPVVRPPSAINPAVVRVQLAAVLRRKLTNPSGALSSTNSESVGPFTRSSTTSFVSRYAKSNSEGTPGELEVTPADIAVILQAKTRIPGSIRLAAALAPGTLEDANRSYLTGPLVCGNGQYPDDIPPWRP